MYEIDERGGKKRASRTTMRTANNRKSLLRIVRIKINNVYIHVWLAIFSLESTFTYMKKVKYRFNVIRTDEP